MLPNFVFEPEVARRIGPLGIALIAALIRAKSTPKKGASVRHLARVLGSTQRHVIDALRVLDAAGVIRIVKHRNGQRSGFDLSRIADALKGEPLSLVERSTAATGVAVQTETAATGEAPTVKTGDSTPRPLPDRIQNKGGGRREVLSAAPIDPTASGEAPRSKTRTKPLHQWERFGPAPSRTDVGFMVQEIFVTAGAEQVWHKTFDNLIRAHGIDVVWRQANMLPTRLVRATKPVENVAGLFIASVENDWSPPSGEMVDKAAFARWCADPDRCEVAEPIPF